MSVSGIVIESRLGHPSRIAVLLEDVSPGVIVSIATEVGKLTDTRNFMVDSGGMGAMVADKLALQSGKNVVTLLADKGVKNVHEAVEAVGEVEAAVSERIKLATHPTSTTIKGRDALVEYILNQDFDESGTGIFATSIVEYLLEHDWIADKFFTEEVTQ